MPSSEEYANKVLHSIEGVGFTALRPMMGDYIVYVEDRPVGRIYEDVFYLEICNASERGLPDAPRKTPYVGCAEMIQVPDDVPSEKMVEIIKLMIGEIPVPKACRRFSFRR